MEDEEKEVHICVLFGNGKGVYDPWWSVHGASLLWCALVDADADKDAKCWWSVVLCCVACVG